MDKGKVDVEAGEATELDKISVTAENADKVSIVSIVCRICFDDNKEESIIQPCLCKVLILVFLHILKFKRQKWRIIWRLNVRSDVSLHVKTSDSYSNK